MNPNTFRLANESDAPAIAKLVNAAYRPSHGTAGWTHEAELVSGERTTPEQVAEIIQRPNSVVLVSGNESAIVACVHIEKENNDSHIGMLAVAPVLQATGIGKQMLAHAENYAINTFGTQKLILVALSARSELIDFYLRRGYQKTGTAMDYPLSAGAGIPKNPALKIERLEKHSSAVIQHVTPPVLSASESGTAPASTSPSAAGKKKSGVSSQSSAQACERQSQE